uniref:SERRATE/Ars2 N-terminal domain-containing protein n=3 Tax=Rhodosorus marinus TaxID=101924 RepID=A0A7S3EAR8_9RHOD|mmetsp:Transcript_21252/g.86927  ORF Transcript_21252/g.86927 Transcript_21252/m.86927 type:complete len:702 (+) Transcript_21252:87-2192(+)
MSEDEGRRGGGRGRRQYDYHDQEGMRGGMGPPYRRGGGRFYDEGMGRRRDRDFGYDFDQRGKRRRHDDDDLPFPRRKGDARESEDPLSFREFLMNQRDDISPEEAKIRYEAYVVEVRKKQPNVFFDEHKNEEWFREKYHPAVIRARMKQIKEETAERLRIFAEELQASGDTALPELIAEQTREAESKQIPAEDEQTAEPREGGELASEGEHKSDEGNDDQPEKDAQERLNEKKGSEGVASNLPKPIDTLFIRGIPTKVTRAQLREGLSCEGKYTVVSLRIGEVQPMRGLSRFAWAKYESAEIANAACEALPDTVIKEPVAAHPAEDDVKKQSEVDASGEAPPKDTEEKEKSPVEGVEEEEGEGGDQSAKADDAEPVEAAKAEPRANVLYRFDVSLNKERERRFVHRNNVLPKIAATAPRLKHDREQVIAVMRHMDKYREVEGQNPFTEEFLASVEDEPRQLDLCIHYLYKVHCFAYYSGIENPDDPTALPEMATRPKIDPNVVIAISSSGDKGNWERKVDDKVAEILARRGDKARNGAQDGSARRNKKLQEWFDANTRTEGEGRFRCALPPYKLFMGVEFVHKHLRLKHVDARNKVLSDADEELFLENYVADPNRIDGSAVQENPNFAMNRPSPRFAPFRPQWAPPPLPGMMRGRGRGMPMRPPPMNQAPMDPRASRVPHYKDLDNPAQGPSIKLVKYEDG